MTSYITQELLSQSLSWEQYYALVRRYVDGPDRPELYRQEKMLRYTGDNLKRMDHVLANINIESKLYNQLSAVKDHWIWVVLAEPWCGDVSQEIAALYTFSTCSDSIDFRVLQSDSHPDVLDHYTTGGSRSIPKLICLRTGTREELGTWGPRPQILQQIVMENKDRTDITFGDKVRMIHAWYGQDATRSIQEEFIDLVKKWNG
ncbi:MAG: thioredoxin family protein [Bacteroidetes bacterium]|nr:thioredoxin family protein [Bacteroidota bacterium]